MRPPNSVTPPRGRLTTRALMALVLALALAGVAAVAGAAVVRGDGGTSARATAAATTPSSTYRLLKQLGVSASGATLSGRLVRVKLGNTRRVEIRLAVIRARQRNLKAWDAVTLRRGSRTLLRRLNRTPRGTGFNLRVTARIGNVRARRIIPLRVIAPRVAVSPPVVVPPPAVPINAPPTAIALSSATVAENEPAGTTVGELSATDANAGDTLSFALVAGAGSDDNAAFTIAGNTLRSSAAFDFESKASYAIRVRVSDGRGGSFDRALTITVTNADDPPVAVNDLATVVEDSGANAVAVLSNDTDADGEPMAVASVTQPANGVVVIAGAGSGVTYTPNANYCNSPIGGADTFTYALNGGSSATVAMTVSCANDAPVLASGGLLNYNENDPPTPIDPALTLTDVDSANIAGATVQITSNYASPEDVLAFANTATITGVFNAATGTLTLSGGDTVANYRTALRAVTYRDTSANPSNATRTVTFRATDTSAATSDAVTRGITVTASDNAPDVDNSAGALAYAENDPATAIDPTITITDADSANLTGATVQITGAYAVGEDVLALPAQPVVTAAFDAPTGRLTLSGMATVAAYEIALEAVTYRNTSDTPSTATRTVTYTARDAGGFGASDTHAITIAAVDDAPGAVNDSAGVGEDSGLGAVGVLANDTDVDAGPKSIASVTQPANGTVVITGGGTGLTYAPDANYCNSPPGTTPDTFTYTLTPGGSSATVSMTVTCADDPPIAVDDAATVAEDAGAGAVDVLANDADLDGGPKTVASVTQPTNGTVVNNATSVSYTPNANACNTGGGGSPDTFTYTLSPGGLTATVSMTVTCDEDDPVALNDSATVGEDSSANAVDVLANDTDVDGGPKAVASVTQPANGAVVITGGGTGVTYTPNANYCHLAPDTFTYTLNGGSVASVAVSVSCADDLSLAVNDSAIFAEDAAAGAVDVLANDTDVESDAITLASASDPANGTVVLTGGSAGAYSGLTYEPDTDYCNSPVGTADTFTYTISGGSTATVFVDVTCADDLPVAVNDSATVLEDASATAVAVLTNDTDVDGGPRTIASATDPLHGTVVLTGGSPGAHTGLTYQPDPNYCNMPAGLTDSFSYALDGGSTALVFMTVTCVDDVPVAVDDGATVGEDASATAVNVLANDVDGDGGTVTIASASDPANGTVVLTGGSPGVHTGLTYQPDANYCNTPPPSDTFTYTINGGDSATVSMTVTCVDDPPVAVDDSAIVDEDLGATAVPVLTNDTDVDGGSKTISSAGDPAGGTVVLTGGSAGAHTGLTYQPDPNYCNTAGGGGSPDTFTYTLSGGSSASVSMTVTCVDDAPVAVNDSATVDEDASAAAVAVLTNDTDIDGGPKTIASATDPAHGTVVLTGGSAGAHTGLAYQPDPNYCNDPPGATPDTFSYTLNGSSNATVSLTVTCINDAPVADDETFNGNDSAIGNTTMVSNDPDDAGPTVSDPNTTISGDILAGDTDIDGPGPLTVTPGTFATNDGGDVTIEADGDFTFHPAATTSCTDTSDFFDYTVEDSGSPELTDTGRVTIAIAGCVWYVHNNSPGNIGTSNRPFDSLAQAETASGPNHTVFVYDGDNSAIGYDAGGYQMNSGERLIGEHEGLIVDPDGGGPLTPDTLRAPNSGAHPTLTAFNFDVIDLDDNNEIRGVNIDAQGTGGAIFGGSGDVGGTLDDINIVEGFGTAGQGPGLELNAATGTFNITNLAINNSASGILLNGVGLMTDFGSTTVSTTGSALSATSTNMSTSTFDALTSTGSNSGGVSMVNTTGTTVFGDGAGTDLSLTTTSGAAAAFLLSNAGTVTVPAGGTANASAIGGPAVDVSATTITSLTFDTVTSTNSSTDGVNLQGLGSATFTANSSSSITNATGIDFDLDGGTGAVTYDGTITDNSGQLVRVQNTSGGLKDFNGAIGGAAGAAGGHIGLSSNGGATIRFDGGVKLSSSGATSALSATGGGTLAVTDPASSNNTLGTTTSTGQALNVVNTTISDDDLTFESIRSSGASNGIVLTSTSNANGRLLVTGAGAACATAANCDGGAIQTSTGAGIALTSVPGGVSLTRIAVTGGLDDGIRATTVNDVDLVDSIVTNNGNFHGGGAEERGLDYLNVTGTPLILRTTVSGSDDSNAHIQNTVAGTTTLVVTGSTFSNSKFNAGLRLRGEGPSVMTATVGTSVFSLNADPGFSMQTDSANSAQQTLTFNDNDVSGGSSNAVSGRPQMSINAGGNSTIKATVTNNDIKSAAGHEVILNTLASHTGTFDAKVVGNDIGDSQPGALDALADGGTAINGWAHGDGINRMEIRNNTVANWGGRAMELSLNDGNGDADYTVSGNLLSSPDTPPSGASAPFEAIYIFSGGATGDASDVCVDMENNDMDGIGRNGLSDIALDRFTGNILRFADFNDTSVPNLQTNLRGKNPLSPALTVETFSFGPTATPDPACDLTVGTP